MVKVEDQEQDFPRVSPGFLMPDKVTFSVIVAIVPPFFGSALKSGIIVMISFSVLNFDVL